VDGYGSVRGRRPTVAASSSGAITVPLVAVTSANALVPIVTAPADTMIVPTVSIERMEESTECRITEDLSCGTGMDGDALSVPQDSGYSSDPGSGSGRQAVEISPKRNRHSPRHALRAAAAAAAASETGLVRAPSQSPPTSLATASTVSTASMKLIIQQALDPTASVKTQKAGRFTVTESTAAGAASASATESAAWAAGQTLTKALEADPTASTSGAGKAGRFEWKIQPVDKSNPEASSSRKKLGVHAQQTPKKLQQQQMVLEALYQKSQEHTEMLQHLVRSSSTKDSINVAMNARSFSESSNHSSSPEPVRRMDAYELLSELHKQISDLYAELDMVRRENEYLKKENFRLREEKEIESRSQGQVHR